MAPNLPIGGLFVTDPAGAFQEPSLVFTAQGAFLVDKDKGTAQAIPYFGGPGALSPPGQPCASACTISQGASLPTGLKFISNYTASIQELGRGFFSRAIGGLRVLITPP